MSGKRSKQRRRSASARKASKARRQLKRRQKRLEKRLDRDNYPDHDGPVFRGSNLHYEVSDRVIATKAGGLGVIHALVRHLKLDVAINEAVKLFKRHLPYFESDHILNIAYSFLAGGRCLQDLEVMRQDEAYMDMLGAQRIPDSTTAGDFLRRFDTGETIEQFMDVVNATSIKVLRSCRKMLGEVALIDLDGSLTPTDGEKKDGIGRDYKGGWGYNPLLVSLANLQLPLFIENRPGNAQSHEGVAHWIGKAIPLCLEVFSKVRLRGDTDFALTQHFDEWDKDVEFVFGYDAMKNVIALADELPGKAWRKLERPVRVPKTRERDKRENVKEEIVREKGYKNIRLRSEDVAEFDYQPTACKKAYRMVVVRKNLSIEQGENVLFDDIRYFFYITNDRKAAREDIVGEANDRCNQENLIEQLKNGVRALNNPAHDLLSNWAYMAIASLAWSLKVWFALTLPRIADRERILRLEFKAFLNALMLIPAQVSRTGRRIVIRLLAYTHEAKLLLSSLRAVPSLVFT